MHDSLFTKKGSLSCKYNISKALLAGVFDSLATPSLVLDPTAGVNDPSVMPLDGETTETLEESGGVNPFAGIGFGGGKGKPISSYPVSPSAVDET